MNLGERESLQQIPWPMFLKEKFGKEFLDSDGNAFFSTAGNLGVMLNVDWFQP